MQTKAGRYRVSKFNNKPLTYDQAFKPHDIAVYKGYLSVHTGKLINFWALSVLNF